MMGHTDEKATFTFRRYTWPRCDQSTLFTATTLLSACFWTLNRLRRDKIIQYFPCGKIVEDTALHPRVQQRHFDLQWTYAQRLRKQIHADTEAAHAYVMEIPALED